MLYNGNTKIIKIGNDNAAYDSAKKVYQYLKPAEQEKDWSKEYLTFEALETPNETDLKFTYWFDGNSIEYSVDSGNTWVAMSSGDSTPRLSVGDKVMFRGNNQPVPGSKGIGHFTSTCRFNAMGNPLSLYSANNFSSITSSPSENWLDTFFYQNVGLVSAKNLWLPNDTLKQCYIGMFEACTSLIEAPELPATTLTQGCYENMFYGCSSLTTAPELPAETLVDECYNRMFYNCTSLNYVKMLATSRTAILPSLENWLSGVSATGTFVKNAAMTTLPTGTSGIPSGWTVVDA